MAFLDFVHEAFFLLHSISESVDKKEKFLFKFLLNLLKITITITLSNQAHGSHWARPAIVAQDNLLNTQTLG